MLLDISLITLREEAVGGIRVRFYFTFLLQVSLVKWEWEVKVKDKSLVYPFK
jgi:hypothetical protein